MAEGVRRAGLMPRSFAEGTARMSLVLLTMAIAVMFMHRSWSGEIALVLLALGAVELWKVRTFDATDARFMVVLALIPASYLLNMAIHGFSGPLFDRPARLLGGFFVYYLVRRGRASALLVFDACAVAAASAGAIAAYQTLIAHQARADATWNAVPFGNYSLLLAVIVACPLVDGAPRHERLRIGLMSAAVGLGLLACVLSGTRASLVAIPVLIVVLSLARPRIRAHQRVAALLTVALAVGLMVIAMPTLRQRMDSGLADLRSYLTSPDSVRDTVESSLAMRMRMWRLGLQWFADHPLTGIGVVHYEARRQQAVDAGIVSGEFLGLANVHNQVIHSLAVGGLLMTLPLLLFWMLATAFFARRLRGPPLSRAAATAGLCVVLGTAVFSMSGALLGTSPDATAFVLLLSVFGGLAARVEPA